MVESRLANTNKKNQKRGNPRRTIEKQRPSVADNPAFQGQAPAGSDHEQANEHDGSILDQTPTTTNPIANNTDGHLANHNTNDFEICDRSNPVLTAHSGILTPALRPGAAEEGLEVTNAEQDITLEAETSAGEDGIVNVPRDRAEGISLHHLANLAELLLCFFIVDLVDECQALLERQICPVNAVVGVAIVWMSQVAEDGTLILGVGRRVARRIVVVLIAGVRAVRNRNLPNWRIVMAVVPDGVHHCDGCGERLSRERAGSREIQRTWTQIWKRNRTKFAVEPQ